MPVRWSLKKPILSKDYESTVEISFARWQTPEALGFGASCVGPGRVDPIRAMSSEENREEAEADQARSVREVAAEGERQKKKKLKRPKPPLPRTEREIDAPDRITLVMLGIMCVMTIVLWIFARSACNYHPPRETRRPRAVKLEELARDPKDAALEMQQRMVQYDFDGALELAQDSAEAEVKKRKAACAGKVKECAENKKKFERSATTAALLERDMGSALVRATTNTPSAGKQTNLLTVERRGPTWKVVSFKVDDGTYKPKVVEEPAPMMIPTLSPSGSAAPAPSAAVSVKLPAKPVKPPAPPPPAPAPAPPAPATP